MRLKPQNSPKLLLEIELEALRKDKGTLGEEVTVLLSQKNLLIAAVSEAQEAHLAKLKGLESSHLAAVTGYMSEIQSLESRKREALRPLREEKERLVEREAAITAKEAVIAEQEALNRSQTSRLAERAQQIVSRASELDEREARVAQKEAALKESERINALSLADLNKKWVGVRSAEETTQKRLNDREQSLELRENSLDSDRNWIESEKTRLYAFERLVKSERSAVQDAYDRLKKKGLI